MAFEKPRPTKPPVRPTPPPTGHPRMPIVEFLSERIPVQVHYSAVVAAAAAQAVPQHEFYDTLGARLTLIDAGDGSKRLASGGRRDPVGLQRRLAAELRETAVGLYPRGLPADMEALLVWLAAAPTFADLIDALGTAETTDHPSKPVEDRASKTGHGPDKPQMDCDPTCSPKQRLTRTKKPLCCPPM